MKLKLYCKADSLKILKTKYKVTNHFFHNYIEISSNKDITDIQQLLNKQILVGSKELSVLD